MGLDQLVKHPEPSYMGIDASTWSFAYCLIKEKRPVEWGIVNYRGKDRYQRILDSDQKIEAFVKRLGHVDVIMQEQAVGSVNQKTGLILAQAYGATMPALLKIADKYEMVQSNVWEASLQRKILTPSQIKAKWPGEKKAWYTEKARQLRKERTLGWVKDRWGIDLPYEANDIGDAIAIASYAAGLVE